MIDFNQIKLMNEATILYLKKIDASSERNEIISKILEDEACFFKISKEDATIILQDIGVAPNMVEKTYLELISSDNYFTLKREGKIKDSDNLKVSYKDFDPNNLFNKK